MSTFKSPIERADEALRGLEGVPAEPTEEKKDEAIEPEPEKEVESSQEQPKEEASTAAGVEPKPKPAEEENSVTYKQRWEALKGAFAGKNREVAQLQNTVQELTGRLKELEERQAPVEPSKEQLSEHLKWMATEYGDEYADMLTKLSEDISRSVVKRELAEQTKVYDKKLEEATQGSLEMKRQQFALGLDRNAPGWQKTLDTEEFNNWLDYTVEPMTGRVYRDLFDEANNNWQLERLSNFFNTFTTAAGKPEPVSAKPSKESLITPGSSGGTNPMNQPAPGKYWTMNEVNQFYKEVQIGKYRDKPKEAERIEAEIDKANLEGRIIPG